MNGLATTAEWRLVRVQLIDPRGDVRPYDDALAAALARRGVDVELVSSRFLYGPLDEPVGYRVRESFYRRSSRLGLRRRRARRLARLVEHLPGMLSLRQGPSAEVLHVQWLPLEALDALLLPPAPARVMTLHNVLRRSAGGAGAATLRLLARRLDALIVHTRHGARELERLTGIEPARVRVIPHGAFDRLARLPDARPLPAELARVEGPVVLCFGTVRPYKGVDVLLEAFRDVEDAELWVVGRPLSGSLDHLHRLAAGSRGRVRFVTRYVGEREIPAFFRRADLVVLPHREVDQSGVLSVALAFGKPIVMSAVGGFVEVAQEHGAGRLVPPGDPVALAAAIRGLLHDDGARAALAERAAEAAAGPYSWDRVARKTIALYEELLAR